MDDLTGMIINDESPTEISSKIKELLQVKAIEKIDSLRPYVSSSLFGFTSEEEFNEND
jgi:hypothetical protein